MKTDILRLLVCFITHANRLAAAVSYEHLELAAFLIANGANVNLRDSDGNTALHFCETAASAKLLIDHGADITLANESDETVADIAFEEGLEDLLDYLVSLGAPRKEE